MELYPHPLAVGAILQRWYAQSLGYGAFVPFVGTVRAEGGIEALSFDVYPPLLEQWFEEQSRSFEGMMLKMAHSYGDVRVHESSFVAAVASSHRREALEGIDRFVETFKATAPIWKYDLIDGVRHYAHARSTPLPYAGILAR